ncbi:hypothetical protein D3C86_1164320 [compost metagenome]
MRRLGTEEHRIIRVLVVAERQEAELAEFGVAAVGNAYFGRAFEVEIAVIAGEDVHGQIFHPAAIFRATDCRAPAAFRKSVGQFGAHDIGGVHPAIFVMLQVAIHRTLGFVIGEIIDWVGFGAIGHARQHTRQSECHETGIVALAEAAPLGIFHRIEDFLQIARTGEIAVILEAEHMRACRRDERCESRRRNRRDALQQLHVIEGVVEFIVADDRAERLAAGGAEFVFVDRLEEARLIEFHGLFQIAREFPLAGIHDADLEVDARLGILDEIVEPAPGAFELREFRRLHDGGKLFGNRPVQFGNGVVEGDGEVAVVFDRSLQRLVGQRAQKILRAVRFGLAGCGNHLGQQSMIFGGRCLCFIFQQAFSAHVSVLPHAALEFAA